MNMLLELRGWCGHVRIPTQDLPLVRSRSRLQRSEVLKKHGHFGPCGYYCLLCVIFIDVMSLQVTVLNVVSRSLPFPVSASDDSEVPKEDTRLKHRVLDIRCEGGISLTVARQIHLMPRAV